LTRGFTEQAKDAKAKLLDGDLHGLFGGVGERKGVPPEKAAATDEDPDAERKPHAPNPMGLGKGSTSPNSKVAAWFEFRVRQNHLPFVVTGTSNIV
jgi:hypothetical protein